MFDPLTIVLIIVGVVAAVFLMLTINQQEKERGVSYSETGEFKDTFGGEEPDWNKH